MSYRYFPPLIDVGNGISPADGAKLFFFDFGTSNAKTTFADSALTIANSDPVIADTNGLFGDIFLDIKADVTLKDKNNVLIFGPKSIFSPADGVANLPASSVAVLDTAGNFTAINAETVLAEIADDYLRANRADVISGTMTFSSANIEMADNQIIRSEFTDYAISHNVVLSVAGVLTLDMTTGNSFVTTLTENITTITISNPPVTGKYGQFTLRIIQDGAAGAFTVTFPAAVRWPSGTAPTISTGNNAIDEVTLHTIDAGTIWLGNFSQAYA